ncbi:MAG: hypothetical protein LBI95_04160 [Holosporales bacterium]|nr:hypothetical protein [Holosporales bacterium]
MRLAEWFKLLNQLFHVYGLFRLSQARVMAKSNSAFCLKLYERIQFLKSV